MGAPSADVKLASSFSSSSSPRHVALNVKPSDHDQSDKAVVIGTNALTRAYHRIPKRYIIAGLLFFANLLCYIERSNISNTTGEFGLSTSNQGYVYSAFFYGYLTTQVLGGFMADRYGSKPVLMFGFMLWICADVLTVPTASYGPLWTLLMVRVFMGVGEGFNFPVDHHLSGAWFPVQERSVLMSIVTSGCDLGTMFSNAAAPKIIEAYGWHTLYVLFFIVSLVWVGVIGLLGASSPEAHPTIHPAERDYILATRHKKVTVRRSHGSSLVPAAGHAGAVDAAQAVDPTTAAAAAAEPQHVDHDGHVVVNDHSPLLWQRFFFEPSAWAVFFAHFFYNYSYYVLLSWIPHYFKDELGVNLAKEGFITSALPYLGGFIGFLCAGWVSNKMISSGYRTLFVRKLFTALGAVGGASALFTIAFLKPSDPYVAVAFLTYGLFLIRAGNSGYWVNMVDVCPDHAGEMMGISNMLATVPGILSNTVTGNIIDATGSWTLVFALGGGSYCIALIAYTLLAGDQDIMMKEPNSVEVWAMDKFHAWKQRHGLLSLPTSAHSDHHAPISPVSPSFSPDESSAKVEMVDVAMVKPAAVAKSVAVIASAPDASANEEQRQQLSQRSSPTSGNVESSGGTDDHASAEEEEDTHLRSTSPPSPVAS